MTKDDFRRELKVRNNGSWRNACPCCVPFRTTGLRSAKKMVRRAARRVSRANVRAMAELELTEWNTPIEPGLSESEVLEMEMEALESTLTDKFYKDLFEDYFGDFPDSP